MMRTVNFFSPKGANGWLANFSSHTILLRGRLWPSVEHYFQAMKFSDPATRQRILKASSPSEAQHVAATLVGGRRPDWYRVRNIVMYNAIKAKFTQHPDLADQLRQTGSRRIVEVARDSYWGSGRDGCGRNQMGRLLMRLRGDLRRRRA